MGNQDCYTVTGRHEDTSFSSLYSPLHALSRSQLAGRKVAPAGPSGRENKESFLGGASSPRDRVYEVVKNERGPLGEEGNALKERM